MNYLKRLYHTSKTSIANDPTFPACMLMLLLFTICTYASLELHNKRITTLESELYELEEKHYDLLELIVFREN